MKTHVFTIPGPPIGKGINTRAYREQIRAFAIDADIPLIDSNCLLIIAWQKNAQGDPEIQISITQDEELTERHRDVADIIQAVTTALRGIAYNSPRQISWITAQKK